MTTFANDKPRLVASQQLHILTTETYLAANRTPEQTARRIVHLYNSLDAHAFHLSWHMARERELGQWFDAALYALGKCSDPAARAFFKRFDAEFHLRTESEHRSTFGTGAQSPQDWGLAS